MERSKTIVSEERRITKQHLSDCLNVSYESVLNMLKSLGLRKLSSRFVPCFRSADICDRRIVFDLSTCSSPISDGLSDLSA